MSVTPRVGGSFAPDFTDVNLARYKTLIDGLDPQSLARDVMSKLHQMAMAWWEQPESTGEGNPHPSGKGVIVELDQPIQKALWDLIPWDYELKAYAEILEKLPTGTQYMGFEKVDLPDGRELSREVNKVIDASAKELRDAAFHLLWLGWELFRDREPITAGKL